jgi:cystathionine gamma-lyase
MTTDLTTAAPPTADWSIDTTAVRGGPTDEGEANAVVYPIYQTSTFAQDEPGGNPAYCYSRTGNPSRTALEQALAQIEGAQHAVAFASGLAAVTAILLAQRSGIRIVACRDLYGGSYRLFTKVFSRFGVTFDFVDTTDPAALKAALPGAAVLWLETPSNPLLRITDLAAACELAKSHGVRTVVDNTFATCCLQRPLQLGADLVLHSTTKYVGGHSDVIGGAVLTDRSDLADELRFVSNASGAVPAPQDCFLLLRGLRTLPLRMERHSANARRVAEFLAGRDDVSEVFWPGLATHAGHEIARRQMSDFGAMLSFTLPGGEPAARALVRELKLFTLAESLGGVFSLVCHPPTMTHAAVEPDVRRAAGIDDGLLRLSIGLESADDLIADLTRSLDAVATA